MRTVYCSADTLQDLTARVFRALAAPVETAQVVASALVDANLAGHDSHGVMRIPSYVSMVHRGIVRPAARPRVVTAHKATALVSGEWGFGQMTGIAAIDEAVTRAQEYGISAVGVVRCTHLGRMGGYVERAAAANCAAMIWVGGLGGPTGAVPYGGSQPAMGTNPVAAGFPLGEDSPVVLDFATTAVAAGKVMLAQAAGKEVPPGSIVDSRGRPTTDPGEFFKGGALLPFGGHKGYALAVIAELFGQALTGADQTGDEGWGGDGFRRAGALFCAVHIGAFRPAEEARRVARDTVNRLRAIPPAAGFERVLTPGEPEARARRERAPVGIALPEETWQAIIAAAQSVGLAPADLPKAAPTRSGPRT